MIAGIGTDLVALGRIRDALARHGERFAAKILGADEQQVYLARTAASAERGVAYLATRFAAKEAIAKALGTGIGAELSWPSAQILNNAAGAPVVVADAALAARLQARGLALHISVSDTREYALAYAIAERLLPAEKN